MCKAGETQTLDRRKKDHRYRDIQGNGMERYKYEGGGEVMNIKGW